MAAAGESLLAGHERQRPLEKPRPAQDPAGDLRRLRVREFERRLQFASDLRFTLARQEQVGGEACLPGLQLLHLAWSHLCRHTGLVILTGIVNLVVG